MRSTPDLPVRLTLKPLQSSESLIAFEYDIALEVRRLLVLFAGALLILQHHIAALYSSHLCPEGICRSLGATISSTCERKKNSKKKFFCSSSNQRPTDRVVPCKAPVDRLNRGGHRFLFATGRFGPQLLTEQAPCVVTSDSVLSNKFELLIPIRETF